MYKRATWTLKYRQETSQGLPLFGSSFSAAESPLTHPRAPNIWRSSGGMESLGRYHKTWRNWALANSQAIPHPVFLNRFQLRRRKQSCKENCRLEAWVTAMVGSSFGAQLLGILWQAPLPAFLTAAHTGPTGGRRLVPTFSVRKETVLRASSTTCFVSRQFSPCKVLSVLLSSPSNL